MPHTFYISEKIKTGLEQSDTARQAVYLVNAETAKVGLFCSYSMVRSLWGLVKDGLYEESNDPGETKLYKVYLILEDGRKPPPRK